jgi:hypothetical protein
VQTHYEIRRPVLSATTRTKQSRPHGKRFAPSAGVPDFAKGSTLGNADGWVEIDKFTLQHVRYPNVFSLGDCSNLPTSKTGAAIRKQAPVVVSNLLSVRAGTLPVARYDGYSSCPVVTGRGKLIMAEFNYDKAPVETFPFDQRQERFSMYAAKAYMRLGRPVSPSAVDRRPARRSEGPNDGGRVRPGQTPTADSQSLPRHAPDLPRS